MIINTIAERMKRKERAFFAAKEAMRKDVERVFGVLVPRWALLAKLCTVMKRDLGAKNMQASVILHHTIVEERRNGYESRPHMHSKIPVENGFFLDENGDNKEIK